MADFAEQLLVAVIPGSVIAVLTAMITVRLSKKRFYSERWWERKAEAYSSVLEALFHMQLFSNETIRESATGRELSPERQAELRVKWQKACDEVSRAVALGAFILSNEAAEHAQQLLAALDSATAQPDYYSYLDVESVAIKRCLIALRTCARKDLGV